MGEGQGVRAVIPLEERQQARAKSVNLSEITGSQRKIPSELLEKARELRKNQTPTEKILWECLRGKRLFGFKFRRQHNIGSYIVDFYCHTAKLVIEIDGKIHDQALQKEKDQNRDEWLQNQGLTILRIKNETIINNLEETLEAIASYIPSSPQPSSPTGEGGERGFIDVNNSSLNNQSQFNSNSNSNSPLPMGEGQGVRAVIPLGEGQGVRANSPVEKGQQVRAITKEDIFYYVYAVLHNPKYREKYELNLKREFPRIPFYNNFYQWVSWGKKLMELHLNYETIKPYPLKVKSQNTKGKNETIKPKLKADKVKHQIVLDKVTILTNIPAEVWEYKLGNRSALEWILDQYKEKKPRDKTIAQKFNNYRFADYKDTVIDLLKRVTTVSVETMKIIKEMEKLEDN